MTTSTDQAKYFGNSADEYRNMAAQTMKTAMRVSNKVFAEKAAQNAEKFFSLAQLAMRTGERVNIDGLTYSEFQQRRIINMIEVK